MNLPMQPDEVREYVKKVGIGVRVDYSHAPHRKGDGPIVRAVFSSDDERRAAKARRDIAWKKARMRGQCDCGEQATVRSGPGWACDRCLRLEREYYDWQHRGRLILTRGEREMEKETEEQDA